MRKLYIQLKTEQKAVCSIFSAVSNPNLLHQSLLSCLPTATMADNTEIVSRKEAPQKPINLFALFSNFKPQFPFWKQQQQQQPKPVEHEATGADTKTPATVRFPKAQPLVPTVASEVVEEPMTKTSNPIIVWQVYALGGFLVLKWIWARWQERKEQKDDGKEESSDDEQSSVDE